MLPERMLLALSGTPGEQRDARVVEIWNDANALDLLRREFPDLESHVAGRRVLDFGCGDGWQSTALAHQNAAYVLGVDTNERCLKKARLHAARHDLSEDRLAFAKTVPTEALGTFDVAISQNSFEHLPDPGRELRQMRDALRPGGRLYITFGPPWLSPSGSHMYFFTPVPWVNVLWSERSVMSVRRRFRNDGAQRYEDVEGGLNRMTVRRFEQLVEESGMSISWRRYHAVKDLQFLTRLPGLREFFVNVVSCILTVPVGRPSLRPDTALSRKQGDRGRLPVLLHQLA